MLVLIYSEVHEAQESRPPRLGYIDTRTHSLTHSLLAKRQRDAHLHRLARWATIRRARVVTRRMKAPLAAVRAVIRLEHHNLVGPKLWEVAPLVLLCVRFIEANEDGVVSSQ